MNYRSGGPMNIKPTSNTIEVEDPRERSRKTATDIARNKVLNAYKKSNYGEEIDEKKRIAHDFHPVSDKKEVPAGTFVGASKSSPNVSLGTGPSASPSTSLGTNPSAPTTATAKITENPVVKSNVSSAAPNTSYKATPIQPQNTSSEWQKYHSAWQNYYQKYYSEYYAKAARQYVQNEQEKINTAADAASKKQEAIVRELSETADKKQEELNQKVRQLSEDASRKQEELSQKVRQLAQELETKEIENSKLQAVVTSAAQSAPIEKSLKDTIQSKANEKFGVRRRRHKWIPIAAGAFVTLFILFLQYNRLIFAPIAAYISPGNADDSGITAIDPTVTGEVGPDPKLIIPKLNVNVPVHFGISNDTDTVNAAMNDGVAQFVIPGANAMPGEKGTVVITGHSAGDIYSNNQYKFIFSGLERMGDNDLIYINYKSIRYTYKVYKMTTVDPTDVNSLLQEDTDKNILVLVTCTPLGTSRYRLLVFAEQVDPVPENTDASVTVDEGTEDPTIVETPDDVSEMPSNEPGFFEGIWNWLTGK